MPTVVDGDCEWDAEKAASNLAKHGVSFEEGQTVLADPNGVYLDDGSGRDRLIAVGMSARGRLLAVVHVERGERDRIVSARAASRDEETIYAEGQAP